MQPDSDLAQAEILLAARALEAGELVAFPTETVYGLGADAENPTAIEKIYRAKGRPSNHPVIAHIASSADPSYWVTQLPALAQHLIHRFWPGPLTLILPRAPHIPAEVAGGQDTIGIRCPAHPVAQALLREFKAGKGGLAAPSANKFGRVSPTTAEHVREEFSEELRIGSLNRILEGGQSEVGIESTILDLSRLDSMGPVLLRPGHITPEQLAEIIGALPALPDAQAPRASGTLASHYAPHTPVVQVASQDLDLTVLRLQAKSIKVALMSYFPHPDIHPMAWRQLSPTAEAYAHDLYAGLRELDHAKADLILVETPPDENNWLGVRDRLNRAAHDHQSLLSSLFDKAE